MKAAWKTTVGSTLLIIGSGFVSCLAQTADQASCRSFVQTFYDSYLKDDIHSANYRTEIAKHPNYFSDDLRSGLTHTAMRRDVGVIDFDPFLNAQDWDGRYIVDTASARDMHCNVAVHSGAGTNLVKVNAELAFFKGSWRFTDFIYPRAGKPERLTNLLRLDSLK